MCSYSMVAGVNIEFVVVVDGVGVELLRLFVLRCDLDFLVETILD